MNYIYHYISRLLINKQIFCITILFLIILNIPIHANANEPEIVSINNHAWLTRSDSGVRSTAQSGQTLNPGDEIQTQPGNSCLIGLNAESTRLLYIEGGSAVRMGSPQDPTVLLKYGKVYALLDPDSSDGKRFAVETPHAVASSLGTQYSVATQPLQTQVQTFTGRVQFAPQQRSHKTKWHQSIIIDHAMQSHYQEATPKPTAITPVTSEDIEEYLKVIQSVPNASLWLKEWEREKHDKSDSRDSNTDDLYSEDTEAILVKLQDKDLILF